MPRPRFDEDKQQFIARCISEVRKEGLSTDKAVERCFIIWKDAQEERDASDPSKDGR